MVIYIIYISYFKPISIGGVTHKRSLHLFVFIVHKIFFHKVDEVPNSCISRVFFCKEYILSVYIASRNSITSLKHLFSCSSRNFIFEPSREEMKPFVCKFSLEPWSYVSRDESSFYRNSSTSTKYVIKRFFKLPTREKNDACSKVFFYRSFGCIFSVPSFMKSLSRSIEHNKEFVFCKNYFNMSFCFFEILFYHFSFSTYCINN